MAKKIALVLGMVFILFVSCDMFLDDIISPKTSTINIYNSSGSSVSATINYGDKMQDVILAEGSSIFNFESNSTTSCSILYTGRYAEFASTNIFDVPCGKTYSIQLKANIGWIKLTNGTSGVINFPKYGSNFFMYNSNGKLLSTDDASSLLIGEEQYCRITSEGNDYIRFQFNGKNYRFASQTNCLFGFTQIVILSPSTYVIEEL